MDDKGQKTTTSAPTTLAFFNQNDQDVSNIATSKVDYSEIDQGFVTINFTSVLSLQNQPRPVERSLCIPPPIKTTRLIQDQLPLAFEWSEMAPASFFSRFSRPFF